MSDIKNDLKQVLVETMIPESQDYLEEVKNENDQEAIEDIEGFLEELEMIVQAIDENKITDEDAEPIYEKIITMLNEHEDEEH